eukprot:GDKI01043276.1.p2 GENE.GDKI01043276.1~~GDKI01043276.1.p2  ORF type:complete len:118 (+),score=22.33 GDKI01043276.1:73-426(+)
MSTSEHTQKTLHACNIHCRTGHACRTAQLHAARRGVRFAMSKQTITTGSALHKCQWGEEKAFNMNTTRSKEAHKINMTTQTPHSARTLAHAWSKKEKVAASHRHTNTHAPHAHIPLS